MSSDLSRIIELERECGRLEGLLSACRDRLAALPVRDIDAPLLAAIEHVLRPYDRRNRHVE